MKYKHLWHRNKHEICFGKPCLVIGCLTTSVVLTNEREFRSHVLGYRLRCFEKNIKTTCIKLAKTERHSDLCCWLIVNYFPPLRFVRSLIVHFTKDLESRASPLQTWWVQTLDSETFLISTWLETLPVYTSHNACTYILVEIVFLPTH